MRFPQSTGEVAQLLGTSEPALAEAVRRKRIDPPPPVVAGRRLWDREHIDQAARVLGVPKSEWPDALTSNSGDRS